MKKPNYKRIYLDLIEIKFPDQLDQYKALLTHKKELSVLEVVHLNQKIFGEPDQETLQHNQRNRSYDKKAILEILDYQKKNKLNNSQLAQHFRLSRNTVSSWKKRFFSVNP
jgi:DNA-binding transcriptional regulator YiaG